MHPGLLVTIVLLVALVWWGLRGWDRLVRIHRGGADALVDPAVRPGGAAARPAAAPDRPTAFPRDVGWMVVPAGDSAAVARALALRTALPANWASGLADAVLRGAFATPALDGHVLVIGRDVAALADDLPRLEALLTALAATFGRAQWFVSDEALDVHGWAFAARGRLERGYLYSEHGGHVWWHGDVSDEERALGCFVDDPRDSSDDDVKWWPDRAVVWQLAARRSFDPARLAVAGRAVGSGLLGRL
ncbi:MAG: hypothetical protein H6835_02335 [Planctomycetes bacterium]|nr:hypothetical protein [Planctomycetota bacterium]